MARLKLPNGASQYGAQLGRANHPNAYDLDVDLTELRTRPVKVQLQRVYHNHPSCLPKGAKVQVQP